MIHWLHSEWRLEVMIVISQGRIRVWRFVHKIPPCPLAIGHLIDNILQFCEILYTHYLVCLRNNHSDHVSAIHSRASLA